MAGYAPDPTCSGTDLPAAKRIVRLSFNQVANSIGSLVDPALGTKLVEDFELVDAEHRAFPPLQSPREGNSLTDQSWGTIDQIAQAVGKHVFDNFATLSNCGAAPTDACAQQYLNGLAQKAYRRPLTAAEQARISALYSMALEADAGATVSEAAQYVVYALVQSPQFLYRTEFGGDWHLDGGLTPYEVASMLSYFLTDDVPDQQLLDAALQNKLSSAADVGPHVERILKTDAAKKNLQGALVSYFSYPNLETQIIQDPAFTGEMRQSMYHEAELFLQSTLWGPPLSELLVSRKGFVNATLAPLYGIAQFPPAGVTLDAQQFAQIELPANRDGAAHPSRLLGKSFATERNLGRRAWAAGQKCAALHRNTAPAPQRARRHQPDQRSQPQRIAARAVQHSRHDFAVQRLSRHVRRVWPRARHLRRAGAVSDAR